MMKEKDFISYEAPQVEVIEVEVEKGFAQSLSGDIHNFGYGGDLNGN